MYSAPSLLNGSSIGNCQRWEQLVKKKLPPKTAKKQNVSEKDTNFTQQLNKKTNLRPPHLTLTTLPAFYILPACRFVHAFRFGDFREVCLCFAFQHSTNTSLTNGHCRHTQPRHRTNAGQSESWQTGPKNFSSRCVVRRPVDRCALFAAPNRIAGRSPKRY